MKSPTRSVGIIEPDGILNGSTRKERSANTTRITGKKLLAYSTSIGSLASLSRPRLRNSTSSSQMAPVPTRATKSMRAKFMSGIRFLFIGDLENGKENNQQKNHETDLLHAAFAGLLLFQ